tara:strand:- start:41 stop:472 length:432 start_codon:yes stop_codon:yes gene_type:complete
MATKNSILLGTLGKYSDRFHTYQPEKSFRERLDVANSICSGEWPTETIDCLAEHAINLHIKDYQFKLDPYGVGFCIEGAPMDNGLTNIQNLLSKFMYREISAIYEHWLPWPGNFEAARENEDKWTTESIIYLKRLTSELTQSQ